MPAPLVLFAPAKINLSLDVLGRRKDGYHLVEMVMQTIDLGDRITMTPNIEGKIEVVCPHPFVPSGEDNLAWKAAYLLRQEYGNSRLGVSIHIEKNIPVAAGLAGGSTDAAAVLRGLNRLWNLNLSVSELAREGAALGADIPFCLKGGTALARGIGDELTELPPPPNLWVILFKPNVGISTAEVYRNYDERTVQRYPDTQGLVEALKLCRLQTMADAMANVLESVTFTKLPMLRRLKQKALEFGALAAMMSGSGPTIFALTPEYRKAIAIYNGLKHQVEFAHITTFREVEKK